MTVELSISLFLCLKIITGQWRVRRNTRVSGILYREIDNSTVASRAVYRLCNLSTTHYSQKWICEIVQLSGQNACLTESENPDV